LSNEHVNAAPKAIWDNVDRLAPLHPSSQEWTRERAVDPDATIAYHPAAAQFYKEHKARLATMAELQKKMLANNP